MGSQPPKPVPNLFWRIIGWVKHAVVWFAETVADAVKDAGEAGFELALDAADESITKEIREDLGLNPDSPLPKTELARLPDFAKDIDPQKESLAETAAEIQQAVTVLIALADAAKNDQVNAWDTMFFLSAFAANESIRLKAPLAFALAELAQILRDDPEELGRLDPAHLVSLVRADAQPGGAERFHQRFFASFAALLQVLPHVLGEIGIHVDEAGIDLDLYYGWDPAPDSPTPATDLVSMRALTMMFSLPSAPAARLAITIVSVPGPHGGPGLFLSAGGSLTADTVVDGTRYRITTGGSGAFDLFIPLGSGAHAVEGGGDPQAFIRLEALRAAADSPAFRIGEAGHTRLDIGGIKLSLELSGRSGGLGFALEDVQLVLRLGEGDGFLKNLSNQELPIRFNLGLVYDTEDGLRFAGGTRAEVSLPVANSVLGAFTVHHADLRLGPGKESVDAAFELTAGLGISLGPFRASIDRVGFAFEAGFREGNLGIMDVRPAFRTPSGIGLVLETKFVKGGGYLFIDRERGEYAGVLEIKLGPINIKAIGILQTSSAERDDWSLLLFLFGQFRPLMVPPGLNWSGAGGMIGLRRGVDVDKLQAGVRLGALDDILFPKDPVADAPRLINSFRTIFPYTSGALTIGPFIELGFLDPQIIILRAGVIWQFDRVDPGAPSREVTRVIVLGQIRAQVPPKLDKKVVSIIFDIFGVIDLQAETVLFSGRLRDSKVAELTLSGMVVVRKDYGDEPQFVLAAGGFHPDFKDLPPGLPAPIDRLAVQAIRISGFKLDVSAYFAITPNSTQFGISGKVKGAIGPVSLEASLTIDAQILEEPYSHFIVKVGLVAQIKYKSHTLAGFKLDVTVEGPGYWHIAGKVVFEILWWELEFPFDEEYGEKPLIIDPDINLGELVQAALARSSAWETILPPGGEGLVTLAAEGSGTFAHPLAGLTVSQGVAPLGVTLERAGRSRIAGANRFEVATVRVGESTRTSPDLVARPFARGQFFDLTEEQRLTLPSFEPFDAGVRIAGDDFTVGTPVAADLRYETAYLDMESDAPRGTITRAELLFVALPASALLWQPASGAAARSSFRERSRAPADAALKVKVGDVPLVAVDPETLEGTGFAFEGRAAASPTAARQAVGAAGIAATIVEAFEVE